MVTCSGRFEGKSPSEGFPVFGQSWDSGWVRNPTQPSDPFLSSLDGVEATILGTSYEHICVGRACGRRYGGTRDSHPDPTRVSEEQGEFQEIPTGDEDGKRVSN